MRYIYNPSSEYEKFGQEIYSALSKKFPRTYYAGGMVRDLLLHREIVDIDVATQALPNQTIEVLNELGVGYDDKAEQFGVITAMSGNQLVEIATLRTEQYDKSRFPKVRFIRSAELDSQRRDFTINALYLDANGQAIMDFHDGLTDLQRRIIKLIGDPRTRIEEDPLRIVRAYRFQLTLQFNFETETEFALKNSQNLLKNISQQRIEAEINKISNVVVRQQLRKVIHNFA